MLGFTDLDAKERKRIIINGMCRPFHALLHATAMQLQCDCVHEWTISKTASVMELK